MKGTSKTDGSATRIDAGPEIAASPASPFPALASLTFGTCSWSFEDWRGNFYPEHLGHVRWLEYYARYFRSVEADSTFYHVPSARALQHWLDCTPADFVFSCKMPRQITHELRLRDCEEALRGFLSEIAPLRPKLGPILIQLPPYFTPQRDELALKTFLAKLPRDFRFAVEFRQTGSVRQAGSARDSEWHRPHLIHFFQKHGICWAWNDLSPLADANRAAFAFLPETTDFLYVRLMGDLETKYSTDDDPSRIAGSAYRYESLLWPRSESLENWATKVRKHLAGAMRAYFYVNNHFEGNAPLTCQRLAMQFGIQIALPHPSPEGVGSNASNSPEQLPLL